MAHFLSNVTHERFFRRGAEHEHQEVPHAYIQGLVHTHDFYSVIRCMCILERTIEDERRVGNICDRIRSWTGDIDGSISIRYGLDGTPTHNIPQSHPNVFVFALKQCKETIWAGMSNGYICIFEINTRKLLAEVKGHAGAVNDFLLAGDIIYSASSDWQIIQWNTETFERISGGQFSGHQNSVRCLALDGGLLYSGGDDSVIRCWDLADNTERTGTWPIIAHHDSVRSICVHDVYLFSSSTDGTINVWNTQTAQLVKQLEVCDASITTMAIDIGSNHLWAGSSDGLINVWDVSTLALVGVIDDHQKTNVAHIKTVARLAAMKAWAVCGDGKIRVLYSDTDPTSDEYLQLENMEQELQNHVESHRNRIIANYEELERCKAELILLEERDKRKKINLSNVLGARAHRSLKGKYSNIGTQFLDKKRREQWLNEHVSESLLGQSNLYLIQRYWGNWGTVTRARSDFRMKTNVSRFMAEYNNESILRIYLLRLSQKQSEEVDKIAKRKVASILCCRTDQNIRMRYFNMLHMFYRSGALVRKTVFLSESVGALNRRSLLAVYWQKLLVYNTQTRVAEHIRNAMPTFMECHDKNLLLTYYRKLQSIVSIRRIRKAQLRAVHKLFCNTNQSMLRYYYNRLSIAKNDRITRDMHIHDDYQRGEMAALERMFADNADLDEETLEKELREKQRELAELKSGAADIFEEIRALEKRNKQLMREHKSNVEIDFSKPWLNRLKQAVNLIKSRGLSCRHSTSEITKFREQCKTLGAEKMFLTCFTTLRTICAKLAKPVTLMDKDGSLDWYVGDMFAKMKKKIVLKANSQIVGLVVAYDAMNERQLLTWTEVQDGKTEFAAKYQHCTELVFNFSYIFKISTLAFRYHNGLDPITGEIIEKAKKSTGLKKTKKEGVKKVSPIGKAKKSATSPDKKKKAPKDAAKKDSAKKSPKSEDTKKKTLKKGSPKAKGDVKVKSDKKIGGKKKAKKGSKKRDSASPDPSQQLFKDQDEENPAAPKAEEDVTVPKTEEDVTAPNADEDVTVPKADEDVAAPKADEDVTAPNADEDVTAPN
eukprot:Tbor_TRINITY_DN5297_c0_g1::TRINITY_DN5297_c0_g1_i4::g.16397::m.16397